MKKSDTPSIHISVPKQRLTLKRGRRTERVFPVSTSRFGLGSEDGSMKTPLGRFRIAEKIGAGLPIETAYKSRKPIRATAANLREDDLIMSRILWLDGLEPHNANSHARYIYIHGTNHEDEIGQPASHGCVRMRNAEIAELFELVEVDTPVVIAVDKPRRSSRKKAEKSVARGKRPA
ncbi:MAG TPA: L,D-transpeptidase [Chthoniobacterales bacterium]